MNTDTDTDMNIDECEKIISVCQLEANSEANIHGLSASGGVNCVTDKIFVCGCGVRFVHGYKQRYQEISMWLRERVGIFKKVFYSIWNRERNISGKIFSNFGLQ